MNCNTCSQLIQHHTALLNKAYLTFVRLNNGLFEIDRAVFWRRLVCIDKDHFRIQGLIALSYALISRSGMFTLNSRAKAFQGVQEK